MQAQQSLKFPRVPLREVTHNKFPASFGHLVEAIFDFFRRRLPKEWKTWRDTITDNFRIISHKVFFGSGVSWV